MIDLKREIQKNKVYTQAWNIFSKLIFAKSILDKEACFLIVVENEKHISNYIKIAKYLDKDTSALIMCNGEREADIWGIIVKNNRVYSQRFELKPEGEAKEYTA